MAVPPRKAPGADEGSRASAAGARREWHRIPRLPPRYPVALSPVLAAWAPAERMDAGLPAGFGGIPAFPGGSRGSGWGGGRGGGGARSRGPERGAPPGPGPAHPFTRG